MPVMNRWHRLSRSAKAVACACTLGAVLAAGGCAIYKPEVIQGNFISREQAAALQPGMPRATVRQVLGTPLLTDMFRSNRWDYVFTIKNRKGVAPQRYAMTVYFEGDVLSKVEGADTLPAELDFDREIGGKRTYKPRSLEASPAQLEQFAAHNKPAAPASLPTAPSTTSYPPLPQ